MADQLKIAALDETDLTVISALCQDALTKLEHISYDAKNQSMILTLNRYAWDQKSALKRFFARRERRLSVLKFDRVLKARRKDLNADATQGVLSLLAITFVENDQLHNPAGTITLTFAGGAALALDVECIEGQLADIGGTWEAGRRPRHTGTGNGLGDDG